MGYLRFFALLAVVGMACDSRAQGTKEVWLDELDLSCCIQDWGLPQADRSVLDTPLTVGGVVYGRGVGTHSISRMLFGLGGDAVSIAGAVGADDKNLFAGKHRFKILGDRKVLWDSGVMRKGDAARAFDVDLSGLDKVLLLVEEAGDGIMYDHADWLEVKITTRGEVEPLSVWARPISKGKYILTPASPETPQINNPLVYGARPGNPFLMPVMASGKRPTEPPAIPAVPAHGRSQGDLRPYFQQYLPFGFPEGILRCHDDAKVRDAARAMHEKLLAYGWTYVNIDDGWPADTRSADGRLLPNEKFPDFKGLSDYVHSLGLKFGIYSSPGPTTCGNYPGSYRHELTDARTWAEWGVDYLKHDYCGYLQIERDSEEKTIQEPYVVMRKALDQVDRDIVYCVGYGAPNVWNWGAEAGGNLWRTTRDITDEWNVVTAIGCFQDVCAQATAPGRYNDPDMLVVGRLGHGWGADAHESELTPDEQYAHISLWAILSAPLLIGCDMRAIDDFTLGLLTNSEVIAVNQDPLVAPAVKRVVPNGQVWYKKLCDGSYALGFFQLDPYFVLWDQDEAEAIQEQNYDSNSTCGNSGSAERPKSGTCGGSKTWVRARARSGRWYPTTGFRWSG